MGKFIWPLKDERLYFTQRNNRIALTTTGSDFLYEHRRKSFIRHHTNSAQVQKPGAVAGDSLYAVLFS